MRTVLRPPTSSISSVSSAGDSAGGCLSLSLVQLGILAVMAAATYVLVGVTLKSTLSALGLKNATLGMLASLAVKGSIPGPRDTALRFRLEGSVEILEDGITVRYTPPLNFVGTASFEYEAEVAELLGIPPTVTQVCLLPVAYYTGDSFSEVPRRPAREVTYLNRWKAPID